MLQRILLTSCPMWPRRRVLKKERKQVTKKRILFFSLLSGGVGIMLIAIGIAVLLREPIFTSPIPLLRSFGGSSEKDESTLKIADFLKKQRIEYKAVTPLNKTTYQIKIKENGDVLLSSTGDLSGQLASLQRIVSRLTMEGKKFTRLDLRYDKPVIVLQ